MDERSRWWQIRDALWMRLAWKLPEGLVYWATVRAGSQVTVGPLRDSEVPTMTFLEVLGHIPRG